MAWTISAFTLVVFGSAVVAAAVGITALRKRSEPLAWPLAVTMFTVVAWAVPHAISFGYADVSRVAFWHRLRYPGTVLAPVAYLVLALQYAGYDRWLTRRTFALLGVVPGVTVLLVWTNPAHGLFWRSLSIARVGGASILVEEFGPWYWVNLGYLYLLTTVAIGVLGVAALRSGPLYRKQATLMFVGGLVPLATNGVVNFAVDPAVTVDLTTSALAVSGLTVALALFHLDLLEIRPVARDRLVDDLDDGVVSVGPNGRIRDFNPTAARVLGDVAVDRDAAAVFPPDVPLDGGELAAETAEGPRRFRTRSTPLTDGRGREIGRIVYLNDVTDLVAREQRISVLNRVLRHNIRNELNVVTGRLEQLEPGPAPADREHVEAARESTRRVVELADKARYVERSLREGGPETAVEATAAVERAVAEIRRRYPDADVEYERPPDPGAGAAVSVVDDELFEMAVDELLDNAIVHNDRERPRVTVRISLDGEGVRTSVADDGPGIPAAERDALRSPGETQLQHGSGLGLWLVQWTAWLSAGSLSFADNEPRGSVVTLTLPAADG